MVVLVHGSLLLVLLHLLDHHHHDLLLSGVALGLHDLLGHLRHHVAVHCLQFSEAGGFGLLGDDWGLVGRVGLTNCGFHAELLHLGRRQALELLACWHLLGHSRINGSHRPGNLGHWVLGVLLVHLGYVILRLLGLGLYYHLQRLAFAHVLGDRLEHRRWHIEHGLPINEFVARHLQHCFRGLVLARHDNLTVLVKQLHRLVHTSLVQVLKSRIDIFVNIDDLGLLAALFTVIHQTRVLVPVTMPAQHEEDDDRQDDLNDEHDQDGHE